LTRSKCVTTLTRFQNHRVVQKVLVMKSIVRTGALLALAALALFVTSQAAAQSAVALQQDALADGLVIPPMATRHDDPGTGGTEGCGDIDPSEPCYVNGSGTANCPVVNSYDTCKQDCQCTYLENKRQCGTGTACLQTAALEKSACEGNCIADWP
jgi:hypothetical protein